MNLEQDAREFLLREIPDLLDAELDTEMREMVQRLMAAFAAEQNRDLIAERDGLRERVGEILRYTKGHEEPGHECVLCLIEATAKGELKPARQYLDGQKEKGK